MVSSWSPTRILLPALCSTAAGKRPYTASLGRLAAMSDAGTRSLPATISKRSFSLETMTRITFLPMRPMPLNPTRTLLMC